MARGEVTMNEIMQVVYQRHWKAKFKAISRFLGFASRLAIQADYQNRKLSHYNYPIEPEFPGTLKFGVSDAACRRSATYRMFEFCASAENERLVIQVIILCQREKAGPDDPAFNPSVKLLAINLINTEL